MTGLVRKASLFCALGLVVAASAMAAVPSPALSQKPAYIDVVGTQSGTPDPIGAFTIIVRDFASTPIANSQVVIDFLACTDMNLCTAVVGTQVQDCPTRTVRGFTDGTGAITFTILGAGKNTGIPTGPGAGCANIIADGVSLVHPTSTEYDENGAAPTGVNGVNGSDLSAWIYDFGHVGANGYKGRSDFNHSGVLDGGDLSFWITRFGSGKSVSGCFGASYCTP
jgi:hypothetical protein